MAIPSSDRLTKAYFAKQIERFVRSVQRIAQRAPVAAGRVVPDVDAIAIHDGRRIDATVMFLDICGFSHRPSWTDQEQETQLRVLSLFFTEMIRVVEDYGGFVEKNTGDGLMAYFVKQSTEGTPSQQVGISAALTMFSAADKLINPVLVASGVPPLAFRICLDHGPITVAKVGSARGFNGIVAIGTTANIAAKMLTSAPRNGILIGSGMLTGLPPSWQTNFVKLKTLHTGWEYTSNGAPYAFWEYDGRWVEPND